MKSDKDPKPTFTMQWSTLGISGLIVGIAGLGSLAVVATIKNVDVLSTVALALAVLAFVIQILTFIGQSVSAAQQNASILATNAETKALLGEVRAQTVHIHEALTQQYNKLLDSFLSNTVEALVDSSDQPENLSPEEFKQAILDEVKTLVEESRAATLLPATGGVGYPMVRNSFFGETASTAARRADLASGRSQEDILQDWQWPPKEVEQHLSIVAGDLDPEAVSILAKFARTQLRPQDLHGQRLIAGNDAPGFRQLLDARLISDVRHRFSNQTQGVYELTDDGISVIHMLRAPLPPGRLRPIVFRNFPWLQKARVEIKSSRRYPRPEDVV